MKEKNAQVSAPLVCTTLFPGVAEVIPAAPVEFRLGVEIVGDGQIDLGRPVAPLSPTITDDELELARQGLGRVNALPFGTPVVQYAKSGEACDDRR